MAKVLGIDFGERRVGLALSSEDGKYAFPYKTVANTGAHVVIKEISVICKQEEVATIVIGLPLDQNGTVGPQARTVKQFAEALGQSVSAAIEFQDERFSSALATQLFREAGKSVKKTRHLIDQSSAQLILETYLERKHAALSDH